MAEREGFEPSIPCGIHDFQSCALGRTMRPLHGRDLLYAGWALPSNSRPAFARCYDRDGPAQLPDEPWEVGAKSSSAGYDLRHSRARPTPLTMTLTMRSPGQLTRLKREPHVSVGFFIPAGGEGGIRTHDPLQDTRFRDARTRPTMRPLHGLTKADYSMTDVDGQKDGCKI